MKNYIIATQQLYLRLTATDGSRGTLDAMELIFYIKNSKNKKNIRSIFIENPKISEHSFSSMITMNEDFFFLILKKIFSMKFEKFSKSCGLI
jgi:hypothetical protein